VSHRVTIACSREQAENLPEADDLFPAASPLPVMVADEPDPARPDDWLLHVYFEREPSEVDL